jgi:hypothetical protein
MTNLKEARQAASYNMQSAIVAQAMGDIPESLRLFECAFEAEKQAALSLLSSFDNEPTRSVLFRSAASLAMNCNKYEEAKKMIYFGLAGNPPKDIAKELTDVYAQVVQKMTLATVPTVALEVLSENPKTHTYFWLKGILKVADAQKHKITIVSDHNKTAIVNVPKDLGHIVRNYWDENVSAYILKQGKLLTLVEIDKISLPKTA